MKDDLASKSKWIGTFDQEERAAWDRYAGDAHIAWASMVPPGVLDPKNPDAEIVRRLEQMAVESADVLLEARRKRFCQ